MVWATDNSCDHGAPLRLHTRHVPAGCALHCSRALTADPCARGQAARLLKPEARPEARSSCCFLGIPLLRFAPRDERSQEAQTPAAVVPRRHRHVRACLQAAVCAVCCHGHHLAGGETAQASGTFLVVWFCHWAHISEVSVPGGRFLAAVVAAAPPYCQCDTV